MKKKKPKRDFVYAGYPISVSYIMQLARKRFPIDKDFDRYNKIVNKIIFRAVHIANRMKERGARDFKLLQVIQKGIKEEWIFVPLAVEDNDKYYFRHWIDKYIYRDNVEPKPKERIVIDRFKEPEKIDKLIRELV